MREACFYLSVKISGNRLELENIRKEVTQSYRDVEGVAVR